MKKKFLTYIAVSSLALGTLGYAGPNQDPRGPNGGGSDLGMRHPIDVDLPDDVAALRDQVVALRDELGASRRAVLDALADDATRGDRADALEAWRTENAEAIETMKTLTKELKTDLNELGIGGDRERVEIPEEIKASRHEMKELATALAASRREAVSALGDDATVEERQAAIDAWAAENADDIAALKAIRESIAAWMAENRPARGGRAGVGYLLRHRIDNFKKDAAEMRKAREELRLALQAASTDEEKQELIAQFREQYRSLMQERRQLKRLERLSGIGTGGDRRHGG